MRATLGNIRLDCGRCAKSMRQNKNKRLPGLWHTVFCENEDCEEYEVLYARPTVELTVVNQGSPV